MRTWLPWIVGFALTFAATSFLLFVYALAQPSLWLPILLGIVFGGLLSFAPRLSSASRAGFATLFGSIACLLWMMPGSETFFVQHRDIKAAFEDLLAACAALGLVVTAAAGFRNRKAKPSYWPIALLMVFGWLICYFSSTAGGATPMVDWVMRTFGLERHTAEILIIAVRKTIHVSFYGVVAAAGFVTAIRNGAARNLAYGAALLTALSYGSFDELRQSTQPDRTGSAWDVLIDMGGATGALVLIALVSRKGRRKG